MRHPFVDGWRIALSICAVPVLLTVGAFALVATMGYCAGGRDTKADIRTAALRDTIRVTDSIRVVVRDTVKVYRVRVAERAALSTAADSAVVIQDDSTVVVVDGIGDGHVTDSVAYHIPPEVVTDLRALRATVATQDTLIRWYEYKARIDSLGIVARDNLIAMHVPPRCSRRCGIAIGAGGVLLLLALVK